MFVFYKKYVILCTEIFMRLIFILKRRENNKMNGKEFLKALDNIVKEKNIDPDVVYDAMELALTSAYKKNFNSKTNVKVLFDRTTGEIKVYSYLTVVPDDKMTKEEYEDYLFEHYTDEDEDENEDDEEQEEYSYFNPDIEIKLSDAKKLDKTLEIGDTIDKEVTTKDFGRVATSTAKQVVIQKIILLIWVVLMEFYLKRILFQVRRLKWGLKLKFMLLKLIILVKTYLFY